MSDIDAEAKALVEIYNNAEPDYAPEIEWFGMGLDRENEQQQFVLEAPAFIGPDGIEALREHGYDIQYIEAFSDEEMTGAQIQVPVKGDAPNR